MIRQAGKRPESIAGHQDARPLDGDADSAVITRRAELTGPYLCTRRIVPPDEGVSDSYIRLSRERAIRRSNDVHARRVSREGIGDIVPGRAELLRPCLGAGRVVFSNECVGSAGGGLTRERVIRVPCDVDS